MHVMLILGGLSIMMGADSFGVGYGGFIIAIGAAFGGLNK